MKLFNIAAIAGLAFLALSTSPSVAAPVSGFVTANVNERAGPSTSYPPIVVIPAGAPVTIFGCLSDNSWCDVSWAGYRGWVYAAYLQATYQSRRVGLPNYIGSLGIPFITFNIGSYWDSHYRSRPFYGQRSRWNNVRPGPDKNPLPKQDWKDKDGKGNNWKGNDGKGNNWRGNDRNDRNPPKNFKGKAPNFQQGPGQKGPNARRDRNRKPGDKDCVWQKGQLVCE